MTPDGVNEHLHALAALKPNWDSYGGLPINRAILAAVRDWVYALPDAALVPQYVVATSAGGINLEWHDGERVLELEFETPTTIRYLKWNPAANVEEEDEFPATDIGKAVELIQWFKGAACP